ncbi:MAG: helix-turn-helix transcriptional regulator [Clostridium sp.]|nr:helix-turn-helix transcriptional regulator [Clostridium sp.]MEE0768405.1 helix-turn-helix transcriptional regulator [Clostridia bacterium]
MSLGNNIFELRKKERISQEKLGERVGVTRQTVSNWELDQTVPDANQLLALSKALNTSIDLLVENDIQNVLEQKVSNVETEIIRNNKFQKIIISVLSIIVALFILAFISLA